MVIDSVGAQKSLTEHQFNAMAGLLAFEIRLNYFGTFRGAPSVTHRILVSHSQRLSEERVASNEFLGDIGCQTKVECQLHERYSGNGHDFQNAKHFVAA
jgi:hypothetical protein